MRLTKKTKWFISLFVSLSMVLEAPAVASVSALAALGFQRDLSNFLSNLRIAKFSGLGCEASGSFVSLADLEVLLKVTSFSVEPFFIKPAGAERWSAFAASGHSTVYLNGQDRIPREVFPLLGFHELLGLAGHRDLNYAGTIVAYLAQAVAIMPSGAGHSPTTIELTEALAQQALCWGDQARPRNLRSYFAGATGTADTILRNVRRGGGDTVGSGGDATAIAFKLELLKWVLTMPNDEHWLDLVKNVVELGITVSGLPRFDDHSSSSVKCSEAMTINYQNNHMTVDRRCINPLATSTTRDAANFLLLSRRISQRAVEAAGAKISENSRSLPR